MFSQLSVQNTYRIYLKWQDYLKYHSTIVNILRQNVVGCTDSWLWFKGTSHSTYSLYLDIVRANVTGKSISNNKVYILQLYILVKKK